jgi:hypothetical protein
MVYKKAHFIGMCLMAMIATTPARALDPGIYTVRCANASTPTDQEFDLLIDKVDLLTMQNTFTSVIAGVRVDDGRRVILTNTAGCTLIESSPRSRVRSK